MPTLRIEKGEGAGRTFAIESQAVIGRDPKTDLPISDEKASRQHARVVREGDGFFLEDLDSKNGTSLNGRKVQGRVPIVPGDHIRIGMTWIQFGVEEYKGPLDGILSDYRVEGTVDQGALGNAYVARQLSLDRVVALRILPPNLVRANPEMREAFLRQLVGLASLDHENVTKLLDFGMDESVLYFTTEHVEGVTLAEYLDPDAPLDIETALLLGLAVAQALAHAHSREVLHGSVTLANVLVGERRIVLTNFAMARILADGTRTGMGAEGLLAEVDYLAPEQLDGGAIDHRADIFSLGVILYRLLAGKFPFRESTVYDSISKRMGGAAKPVDQIRPEIPPQVAAIVKRCLEKNLDARYQKAADLVNDLRKVHAQHKALALQGRAHRILFGLRNEFYYLLDWAPFRWVFFPFLAILLLIAIRFSLF
ncbi:MAG: protein kinase [Planctomycetes bacterium]|nr:protein kinase [Planctomycetota bacterium]